MATPLPVRTAPDGRSSPRASIPTALAEALSRTVLSSSCSRQGLKERRRGSVDCLLPSCQFSSFQKVVHRRWVMSTILVLRAKRPGESHWSILNCHQGEGSFQMHFPKEQLLVA